jgi:hypothetical protein
MLPALQLCLIALEVAILNVGRRRSSLVLAFVDDGADVAVHPWDGALALRVGAKGNVAEPTARGAARLVCVGTDRNPRDAGRAFIERRAEIRGDIPLLVNPTPDLAATGFDDHHADTRAVGTPEGRAFGEVGIPDVA